MCGKELGEEKSDEAVNCTSDPPLYVFNSRQGNRIDAKVAGEVYRVQPQMLS